MCSSFDFVTQSYQKPHLHSINLALHLYNKPWNLREEDLANLVGVRRETIGNLEKGKYNPSLVLAWNIAKVFHVSIEEIFTVEE